MYIIYKYMVMIWCHCAGLIEPLSSFITHRPNLAYVQSSRSYRATPCLILSEGSKVTSPGHSHCIQSSPFPDVYMRKSQHVATLLIHSHSQFSSTWPPNTNSSLNYEWPGTGTHLHPPLQPAPRAAGGVLD